MAVGLLFAEIIARHYLGLGDPPLTVRDAQIEYLFAPDQDVTRFGKHLRYNHYSMRSEDFGTSKSNAAEIRVMLIGDSVINGGSQTDQSELATELIRTRLSSELRRPVVVGNISAGSWGPQNQLAYVERFGFFDADVIVIVVSSHDYADAPTFPDDLGPDAPTSRPPLAVWEAVTRYLPRYLSPQSAAAPVPPPTDEAVGSATSAFAKLIDRAKGSGAAVIVAQHLEKDESRETETVGHSSLRAIAEANGVEIVQLGPMLTPAMYRDSIHPNAAGQEGIAAALIPVVRKAIENRQS